MKKLLILFLVFFIFSCAQMANDAVVEGIKQCESAGFKAVIHTNLDGTINNISCEPKLLNKYN